MKKVLKIGTVILVILLALTTVVNATAQTDWTKIVEKTDTLEDSSNASDSVEKVLGTIINALRIISVGIALLMLAVLAMKYMSASAGDRAEIKKHAVVYVVGAVVLFATSGILSIIQTFATTNIK